MSFLNKKIKHKNKLLKQQKQLNNSDNNSNNSVCDGQDAKDWAFFSNLLLSHDGFIETCIFDLNSGDCEGGTFKINFQQYQELSEILKGNNLISISCSNRRFFITVSNDIVICGRDPTNHSLVLRRTKNKCVIAIFDMAKLSIDIAHIIVNDVYNQITEYYKEELFLNL